VKIIDKILNRTALNQVKKFVDEGDTVFYIGNINSDPFLFCDLVGKNGKVYPFKECSNFDGIIKQFGKPDFVRIYVPGGLELDILRGLTPDFNCVFFVRTRQDTRADVVNYLFDHGFKYVWKDKPYTQEFVNMLFIK